MLAFQFAAAWTALVLFLCFVPALVGFPTAGADLVRLSAQLALLAYGLAATLLLLARPADWRPLSERLRLARCAWTMGWLTYLLHVGLAFHFLHDWSHAAAVEHTAAVGGFGAGIWFNHLFTLVWTADVLAWQLRPAWYAERPARIEWLVHGYMTFIILNAAVVFAAEPMRWLGVALYVWLGLLLYRRKRLEKCPPK